MCSVLLLQGVLADASLAVLFVRDEDLSRGGGIPEIRADYPGVIAPRDPRAGGTWFGISGSGFLAGLVNRKGDPEPEEGLSRGHLMLQLLAAPSLDEALKIADEEVRRNQYGGCRVFVGDGRRLSWVDLPVSGRPSPPHDLEPGTWIMRHVRNPHPAPAVLKSESNETATEWFHRVGTLVADHQPADQPLCQHGQSHGSVDTTFAALDLNGRPALLRHLQGGPCSGDPDDFGELLVAQLRSRKV